MGARRFSWAQRSPRVDWSEEGRLVNFDSFMVFSMPHLTAVSTFSIKKMTEWKRKDYNLVTNETIHGKWDRVKAFFQVKYKFFENSEDRGPIVGWECFSAEMPDPLGPEASARWEVRLGRESERLLVQSRCEGNQRL